MADAFNANAHQTCGCDSPRLFPEFEPATYEAWYQEAVASLKGAPFEKKVITKTYEEIDLQPMYWAKDVEDLPHMGALPSYPAYARGTEPGGYVLKPWDICQEIDCSTPQEFNEVARHDLARGQNALKLVLDRSSRRGLDPDVHSNNDWVGKNGLSLATVDELGTALRGIDLRTTPLMIHAGAVALPMVVLLAAYLRHQGDSLADIRCCVGADPLAELVTEGKLRVPFATAYDTMSTLVSWSKGHAPHLQTILVHGSPYHDAGGSAVQELAYAIATGVEYLRELSKRRLSVDDVAPCMRFVFSLGPNFFMEIAKLRAARILWAQVVQAFACCATLPKPSRALWEEWTVCMFVLSMSPSARRMSFPDVFPATCRSSCRRRRISFIPSILPAAPGTSKSWQTPWPARRGSFFRMWKPQAV